MHERDIEYDNTRREVPPDLQPFYKFLTRHSQTGELHTISANSGYEGIWAYVCPCCNYVFPPGLPSMVGSFRAHVADIEGSGCFFNPKKAGRTTRKTELARF
jgi:hypothetical protein